MIERYPQNLEDIFYGIDKIDIITYSSIIETHYIDYKKLNLNNEKILQILQIMKKINVWDKGFFRKICVPQIYFEIFNPEKDSIHINPLEELAPLLNFCEFPLKTYIQNIEKNIDSYNPSTLYSYARIFMDLKKEDKFLLSEFIESTIKPIKKIKDIPIWIIIKSYNENPGYLKNQLCLSDIDIETALHIYSLNKKDIDEYIKIQILNLKKPKCI